MPVSLVENGTYRRRRNRYNGRPFLSRSRLISTREASVGSLSARWIAFLSEPPVSRPFPSAARNEGASTFITAFITSCIVWYRGQPIVASRDKLLSTDLLQHARSFSDVMMIARLTNLTRNVSSIGRTSANWASRWRALGRDLPEQDVLDVEADLLSLALGEARPGSWDLIAAVLPELRGTINARPLGGDARQILDRSLPGLGYDNWDLNRRILLALHHLQKRVSASRQELSVAGLSEVETDFVIVGPPEEPKRKVGLFWWLS
jgi:hypothetical protein